MDFAFYWLHTDAVSKTLFFILIALSLVSWVIGIMRVLNSRRQAERIADDLTANARISDAQQLPFEQRKMITEQLLLQQIARHRVLRRFCAGKSWRRETPCRAASGYA